MPSDAVYFAALSLIPGIGPARIKLLYEHFRSAEAVWSASADRLASVAGIGSKTAGSLVSSRAFALQEAEKVLPKDAEAIPLSDERYPSGLYNIYDPPPVLYVRGDASCLCKPAVAVVGTRKATSYGREVTEEITAGLVRAGITIVSGLAMGIDTFAHTAALDSGGSTVAVLGNSLDRIYPDSNRSLAVLITGKGGALVSELPKEIPVDKWMFPRRNRIISGLSLGTLVIEGAEDSGSLITARCALEHGREVFAVPGPLGRTFSSGPNSLIKQGAKLVECAGDILDELNIGHGGQCACKKEIDLSSLNENERKVIELIRCEPAHIDRILTSTGLDQADIYPVLMNITVRGFAEELPGKYYRLR